MGYFLPSSSPLFTTAQVKLWGSLSSKYVELAWCYRTKSIAKYKYLTLLKCKFMEEMFFSQKFT